MSVRAAVSAPWFGRCFPVTVDTPQSSHMILHSLYHSVCLSLSLAHFLSHTQGRSYGRCPLVTPTNKSFIIMTAALSFFFFFLVVFPVGEGGRRDRGSASESELLVIRRNTQRKM